MKGRDGTRRTRTERVLHGDRRKEKVLCQRNILIKVGYNYTRVQERRRMK